MCGISVVICKNELRPELKMYYSLMQLQNRGYDSIGVGYTTKDKIIVRRSISSDGIYNLLTESVISKVMIGHTRWATHGVISIENAHPHTSNDGLFSLVHNGIIDNFKELKDQLNSECVGDTDSEVVVQFLSHIYTLHKDPLRSIESLLGYLKGTYALAILCYDKPDVVYLARKGSPMLLGQNDDYIFAVSEASGFCGEVKNYIIIPEDKVIVCSVDNTDIWNESNNYIASNITYNITPYPYEHWMLKEIMDNSLFTQVPSQKMINRIQSIIKLRSDIVFLGCGSSFYACITGARFIKNVNPLANITVADAAEYDMMYIRDGTLFIVCTQSGETMDLIKILDRTKYVKDCYSIGIVNVLESHIARKVDICVPMGSGREVCVASTKSYISSLFIFYILTTNITHNKNFMNILIKQIQNMHGTIDPEKIYSLYDLGRLNCNSMYIVGRGRMEAVAKECALKFKEVCYIHAEAMHAGSLKHGPLALIDFGFPVILLVDIENQEKMETTYHEIITRGGCAFVICDASTTILYKDAIKLPYNPVPEIFFANILHLFAYCISVKNGINPDRPRNLAKVVTVE